MSLFDHAFYLAEQELIVTELAAWEAQLEATTPEPEPNPYAANVWASGMPVE